MGGPMALNLVKAGFEVTVHDVNPVYQMGRAAGFSKQDGSSLVKVYEQLAGLN
jgi:3-hydroxyisobutyrate dehydrogenase-like beta-hydroxyacid dehydrogenase